jgi:inorganic pyrophosphatase
MYKELEGKTMKMRGWRGIDEAYSVINASRERYLERKAVRA